MNAGKRTTNAIFFQGSYVFGEKKWEGLLRDMKLAVPNSNSGSIISKQQATGTISASDDTRTLVESEQRLTTLSIFFKVLHLKPTNAHRTPNDMLSFINEDIAPAHKDNDVNDFTKIISWDKDEDIDGESNMVKAYNYFRKKVIPEKLDPEKLGTNIMSVVSIWEMMRMNCRKRYLIC